MSELGVRRALILSHGADLPWLTGYRAMPLERITALVLTASGDAVLVVPELEAPRVPHAADLFELRPWGELEDPVETTCRIIARGGGTKLRVGISDRAWAGNLLAFQEILSDASWLPASGVTSDLRAVKDENEIASLRAASAAADRVAISLQGGDLPLRDSTEAEVSEDISERLVAEGHSHVNFAIVGSGPNGASPHHDAGTAASASVTSSSAISAEH